MYNALIKERGDDFMKFCDVLNNYTEILSCTAKELCALSGISAATFSRYKRGERVPELGSDSFENLCRAIEKTAEQKNILDITYEKIKNDFAACEDFVSADREALRRDFNALIAVLDINLNKLCRHTSYDVSTVFRIRNGTRNPADPHKFAASVAGYVAREHGSPQDATLLSGLIGCEEAELSDSSARFEKIQSWLLSSQKYEKKETDISNFLTKLDKFDLNEYIKAIKFDELKVPTVPFQIPSAKTYFGLKEMMESELDFLKATVLSKSMHDVTMYSDMPMEEMAKDADFPKKWMFGMAMLLKKGLHLNQIHNLDRSFEDMMLGLESWIPMYMTGQISPYYLKNVQNNSFLHLIKVSGSAALSGEAVAGHHSDGKYYLTKSKKEVEYYSKRAQQLLSNAYPLMEIYRADRENELKAFLLADAGKAGKRRSIISTLPLYTLSEKLLGEILKNHAAPGDLKNSVLLLAANQRQRAETILKSSTIESEILTVTPKEFDEYAPSLDLSGMFCETDIPYSYEEYLAHLKETENFAAEHPNYTLKKTASHAFCNLQINIHEGRWAMVSKGKAPAIHFVIRHPKLREAIENFIPPVVEE